MTANQVPVLVVGVLLFLLGGLNSLLYATRGANRNGEWWDVFRDDRTSADSGALPNTNSGEDNDIGTNPTVIFNENRMPEFHKLLARENASIVPSGQKTGSSANLNAVADHNQTRIQDSDTINLG